MAVNKNHHFVPQFYLRNFGHGGSIGLYNFSRRTHIPTASIKGQCQRPYLYGRDPTAEKVLATLEGATSQVISDVLDTGNPPAPVSPEYFRLVTFVVFQWGRTPAAGAVMDAVATQVARAMLKSPGVVPDEMRGEIDSLRVEYKSPVTNAMKLVASTPHMLFDLALKVLVNRSGTVYTVGKRNSLAVDVTSYDVVGINRLQLVSAEENLYYSGSPATASAVDKLPFKWRRTQSQAVQVHRAVEDDGSSELLHVYHQPSDARLGIPCIKVPNRAKAVPLNKRTSMYREAALQADEEVNGPREAKYGPPPTRSRTWKVVED